MKTKYTVWIDLENTPHVLFFNPIIKELENRNIETIVTARKFGQIYELSKMMGIKIKSIGKHYGKNKILKVVGLLIRTFQLSIFMFPKKPSMAFSHGARAMLLASKLMHIPCLTAIDYEHSNHSPYLISTKLLMPKVLYDKYDMCNEKRKISYPGIKEDVYVYGYKPDTKLLEDLNIKKNEIVVTVRPPATEAHYHNQEAEILFEKIIDYICNKKETRVIMLPRTHKQECFIRAKWDNMIRDEKIVVPRKAYNGLDLIWNSDLVLSGGGTMIREAASLNVPAYSFFKGRIGEVDMYLINEGKLVLLENEKDIYGKIEIKNRDPKNSPEGKSKKTLDCIIEIVVDMLKNK